MKTSATLSLFGSTLVGAAQWTSAAVAPECSVSTNGQAAVAAVQAVGDGLDVVLDSLKALKNNPTNDSLNTNIEDFNAYTEDINTLIKVMPNLNATNSCDSDAVEVVLLPYLKDSTKIFKAVTDVQQIFINFGQEATVQEFVGGGLETVVEFFTIANTTLDCESLSKIENTYEKIISEGLATLPLFNISVPSETPGPLAGCNPTGN